MSTIEVGQRVVVHGTVPVRTGVVVSIDDLGVIRVKYDDTARTLPVGAHMVEVIDEAAS